MAVLGGVFMIPVSEEVRKNASVAAGDRWMSRLNSTMSLVKSAAADFTESLDQDADARRFFDGLSYSNKRRFVMGIKEAKTPETRQRRIDKAIIMLREGKVSACGDGPRALNPPE